MDRLLIKYVLLGDTAKCAYDSLLLQGDTITLGFTQNELTVERLGHIKNIKSSNDVKIEKDSITYDHDGVTVEIKVIQNEYEFFKYPDAKVYQHWLFNIPNQFDKYWKVRGIIK